MVLLRRKSRGSTVLNIWVAPFWFQITFLSPRKGPFFSLKLYAHSNTFIVRKESG